ncbi:D-glucuronyl C5-epimerase family protein [Pedococcus sp. KACC 23699]|uniref:D-glucuronyl C5-epimerase family protein n=1 Tax=Pedococcus sp. KACC 23699 TaxID=3149228 RepID=A0AAU7JXT2_9MICO
MKSLTGPLCIILATALLAVSLPQAADASVDHNDITGSTTAHAVVVSHFESALHDVAAGSVPPSMPDPLELGTVFPPSRDVAAVERSQSLASPRAATTLATFNRSGIQPVMNARAPLPYELKTPATKTTPVPSTAAGVPLRYLNGKAYDHPSNQAVWGIQQLESYRLTGDDFYLDRAQAAGKHLLDTSVASRGALWFPYPIDFVLAGDKSVLMRAPWYSAMAQGGVLSLFIRLWAVTGEQQWRAAAVQTLASLTLAPLAGQPWVTHVDASGYLWLEEYPRDPEFRSERVLNGSIFALYGLHDYWRLAPAFTETTAARALAVRFFDGGATTVDAYASRVFRAPGWISRYSLLHVIRNPYYHDVHTRQLLQLQYLTAQSRFAQAADLFRSDYPVASQPGSIFFAAGTHPAYKFDGAGGVTSSMSRRLPASSSAPNDERRRIRNHGIYYHMTKGAFQGWWVPEAWPSTYQRSILLRHNYFPDRQVRLQHGNWTAYQYDSFGTPTARRSAYYASPTSAPASASAIIHGQLHLLISRGRYAGCWLPVTPGVTLG